MSAVAAPIHAQVGSSVMKLRLRMMPRPWPIHTAPTAMTMTASARRVGRRAGGDEGGNEDEGVLIPSRMPA